MRRLLILFLLAAVSGPLSADIPNLQLDGTYSKENPYRNDYPYTELDVAAMEKNPYGVGIKAKISEDSPEFASLTEQFKAIDYKLHSEDLYAKYVRKEEKEIELTEKEKEIANAYPEQFPVESSQGVRIQTSNVLKLADKEYNCNGAFFLGAGDWNGDKVDEVFMRFNDGATHAGAMSYIRVFSENGDYVWATSMMTLGMGFIGLFDYDDDGRVELLLNPGKPDCYIVLGCSATGEKLEPYQSDSILVEPLEKRSGSSAPPPIRLRSPFSRQDN